MRVLIRLHRATIGGSQRSFLQLAQVLRQNGYDVEFAADQGEWVRDGRFSGFRFHEIPYSPFRWGSLTAGARTLRLLKESRYDVIHANGAYLAMEITLPAALAGTPVVATLPGGRLPLLPIAPRHPVVCFSRELEDALARDRPRRRAGTWMVGNRIDCAEVRRAGDEQIPDSVWFPDRGGMPFLITMTTRMDPGKRAAVEHCLQAASSLRRSRTDFRVLFIGGGRYLERFRGEASRINEEAGDEYVRFCGPLANPFPVVRRADVVLGVGLSALEGGIFGRPAVIVGEMGYAGTLSSGSVEQLEYFNFSGRNVDSPVSPDLLTRELDRLLSSADLRSGLGEFARGYVADHLTLEDVFPQYDEAYRFARKNRPGLLTGTLRAVVFLAGAFVRLLFRRRSGARQT